MSETRRAVLSTLMCLALALWSIAPAFGHSPHVVAETPHQVEEIADQGQADASIADRLWASHGHSHESADHDHGKAIANLGPSSLSPLAFGSPWQLLPSLDWPGPVIRIERPPRV
ncbi:MAG: hypothetical protein AAFY02_00095 [Pseudomonadota bacterium]